MIFITVVNAPIVDEHGHHAGPHGLEGIYHAEHQLLETRKTLADLESNTEREAIAQAVADYREETEGQIDRLEAVFEMFGEPPEKEACKGIGGLFEEYEGATATDSSQAMMDDHNTAAAEKTERHEVAAYGNRIPLADQLVGRRAADLLEQTLRKEQEALDELTELTEGIDR